MTPEDTKQIDLTQFESPEGYHGFVMNLAKDGVEIVNSLDGQRAHLLHMAIGVSGEVAELFESVFLLAKQRDMLQEANGNDLPVVSFFDEKTFQTGRELFAYLRKNLVEELGDIHFYVTGIPVKELTRISVSPEFPISDSLLDSTMKSLVAQAGKLLDAAKRVAIYGKGFSDDLVEQIDHAVSILYALVYILAQGFEITQEEIRKGNIAKLAVRYKGLNYSDTAAIQRADKDTTA